MYIVLSKLFPNEPHASDKLSRDCFETKVIIVSFRSAKQARIFHYNTSCRFPFFNDFNRGLAKLASLPIS